MNIISAESIENAAEWISNLEKDEDIEKLIDDFGETQPLLFTYLMMMGEEDLNEEENELLLYLGLVIWKAAGNLAPVEHSVMEAIKAKNEKYLEALHVATEAEAENVLSEMEAATSQPAIFAFVSESIDEESDWIRPANRGIMIFLLSVMIDCLS
ncbi:MAG: hypothetical protein SF052_27830 [Bacteroidia bacterium]|nr:hypothetical protein [Bacteroidia bacterium]